MIPCGAKKATMGMLIRFISGPLFMAGASLLVGLRGSRLHAAIVQVNYSEFTLIWPIYIIVGKLKKTYLLMEKVFKILGVN